MGVLSDFCNCRNKANQEEINLSTCEENFDYLCPFSDSSSDKKEPNFNFHANTLNENNNKKHNLGNEVIKSNTLGKKQTDLTTNITYNINTSYEMNINYYNKLDFNINNNSRKSTFLEKVKNKNSNCKSNTSNKKASKLKKFKQKNKTELYIGDKKGEIKEGFGKQIWTKDSYYIGEYKDDKANGLGKFVTNNNVYKGEFISDSANGYGIYNYNNNEIIFEGYWDEDVQNEYGIEKWKDGSVYMGQYFSGKKNGIGTYMWLDGTKYEGEFKDNAFHGYGIYYFTEKKIYMGQWIYNKKDGYGEFIIDDKIFMGFYRDDKKNGFGIFFWKSECKLFVGFWKEGKKDGFGKIINKNRIKYGLWKKDEKIKIFKNEDEAFIYLDNNRMENYKNLFSLPKNQIIKLVEQNHIVKSMSKLELSSIFNEYQESNKNSQSEKVFFKKVEENVIK